MPGRGITGPLRLVKFPHGQLKRKKSALNEIEQSQARAAPKVGQRVDYERCSLVKLVIIFSIFGKNGAQERHHFNSLSSFQYSSQAQQIQYVTCLAFLRESHITA
jgi:hypothetical protein